MNFSFEEFYKDLKTYLPTSTDKIRKEWAEKIIHYDIDMEALSKLLYCNKKIAMRYSWLLSDIGSLKQDKLLTALPYLLKQSEQIDHFNFTESFATYWSIVGVPVENEAKAIDLLFEWVMSKQVNVTIKSRSLKALCKLTQKYPELKNELSICINDQKDKYSHAFRKRATKLLTELDLIE